MPETVFQLFIIIFTGLIWRLFAPGTVSPENLRAAISSLVFYLLLPALALLAVWSASWHKELVYISILALTGVFSGFGLMTLGSRFIKYPNSTTGALIIAASFGNVTYMGLPVLESLFGDWSRLVVVQYDLFANTPLLFSLGAYVGAKYGTDTAKVSGWRNFITLPYLWTALAGFLLNLFSVELPALVLDLLENLSQMIAPLMLFAIGLAMQVREITLKKIGMTLPVALIQLVFMPLAVYFSALMFGLEGKWLEAAVLEAAMPVMLLGMVFCDRFRLDIGIYAIAATFTTLLSMLTLPLWHMFLSNWNL